MTYWVYLIGGPRDCTKVGYREKRFVGDAVLVYMPVSLALEPRLKEELDFPLVKQAIYQIEMEKDGVFVAFFDKEEG